MVPESGWGKCLGGEHEDAWAADDEAGAEDEQEDWEQPVADARDVAGVHHLYMALFALKGITRFSKRLTTLGA